MAFTSYHSQLFTILNRLKMLQYKMEPNLTTPFLKSRDKLTWLIELANTKGVISITLK